MPRVGNLNSGRPPANTAARIAARRNLGALSDSLVKPKTLTRYVTSVTEFKQFHNLRDNFAVADFEAFDQQVGDFLCHMWETGRTKSEASYMVAALQFFKPMLKHRLNYSWRLLKAWNKLELPTRAFPLGPSMVAAFAHVLRQWKEQAASWLILVGFSLFLRTGELLKLQRKDIMLAMAPSKSVVFLRDSKGINKNDQQIEKLVVYEATADLALRKLCEGLSGPDYLWPHSPQRFRDLWHSVVKYFELEKFHVIPYSMRRSGATAAHQNGVSLDHLLVRGRWKSISTARIYLDEALLELGNATFSRKTTRLLYQHHQSFQQTVSQLGKRGR